VTVDTVLVTGAFGQIGKRCTEILLSRGRTVVATDLRTEKTAAVAQELPDQTHAGTLVPVYADLLDAAAIQELVAEYRPGAISTTPKLHRPVLSNERWHPLISMSPGCG
jgi:NAD(P)-dependent dehydrogenase (short-subunit alcohol dehydrogenase family)